MRLDVTGTNCLSIQAWDRNRNNHTKYQYQGQPPRHGRRLTLPLPAHPGKANETVDVLIIFDPGGQLKIPGGFRFVEKTHTGPSVDDLNINKAAKDKK